MGGINRKIKRNNTDHKSSMASIDVQKTWRKFGKIIQTKFSAYNKKYFKTANSFITAYELVFFDYLEYIYNQESQSKQSTDLDLLDFLYDSVKNNVYLFDSIRKIDFRILNEHIHYSLKGDHHSLINMGEFYVDTYRINCSGSYLFIEDLKTNKKYMYYGD